MENRGLHSPEANLVFNTNHTSLFIFPTVEVYLHDLVDYLWAK